MHIPYLIGRQNKKKVTVLETQFIFFNSSNQGKKNATCQNKNYSVSKNLWPKISFKVQNNASNIRSRCQPSMTKCCIIYRSIQISS